MILAIPYKGQKDRGKEWVLCGIYQIAKFTESNTKRTVQDLPGNCKCSKLVEETSTNSKYLINSTQLLEH